MQLSTVIGTELGAQEWRDAAFLRYVLEPPDLPKYCEGCNAQFLIYHALDCKRGVLVTARNNELRYGVADLSGKAFNPSHVRNNPLIYQGCKDVPRPEIKCHQYLSMMEKCAHVLSAPVFSTPGMMRRRL